MKEIIFALACISGVLIVGTIANRWRRNFFQHQETKFLYAVIELMAILLGFIVGLAIIPSALIPDNGYTLIAMAIGTTLALGSGELFLFKALRKRPFEGYSLDGIPFPFISIGFACSLILKRYVQ